MRSKLILTSAIDFVPCLRRQLFVMMNSKVNRTTKQCRMKALLKTKLDYKKLYMYKKRNLTKSVKLRTVLKQKCRTINKRRKGWFKS